MLEEKYIVVAYDTYYPSGGLDDIKGIYDTQEEADTKVKELENPNLPSRNLNIGYNIHVFVEIRKR